jgi:ATP-dependent Clp protease adaptor protein ClpS
MTKTLPLLQPGTATERCECVIPLYKVLLHNDDHNIMDHVIKALMRVFNFEFTICRRIMMAAHHNGVALCTVEPLEKAEHHRNQLASFSLISTIEPE